MKKHYLVDRKAKSKILIVLVLVSVLSLPLVYAPPVGPISYDIVNSTRLPSNAAGNISAVAGNVTEINFDASTITKTWQGYFGSIVGTLVLGNSNNQSLYNWNLSSPSGEIYATRISSVPDWSNINCAGYSHIYIEDEILGVNQTIDSDSVNNTFLNTTIFDPFYVGNIYISNSLNCYAVNLNGGNGGPSTDFQEVLLYDGNALIYTAIINPDSIGFDNRTHDFEMIVGEDGHKGDSNPTPYYFYLELY